MAILVAKLDGKDGHVADELVQIVIFAWIRVVDPRIGRSDPLALLKELGSVIVVSQ